MDIYGIKIISWMLGGRHTRPLATMPFISACVNLQQQSGCAIDLESLGIRQTQRRRFNLDVSDNLYETEVFFHFHRLHWVWKLVQVEPDFSKETCEEQEMEMDTYGIKIISWMLGGRHTRPLATMPFISACVNLQQQSGCAIDLESLGIRQTQRRRFNLDVSDNLYETEVFFHFHRLHWVWKLVQVEPDFSKETCEEQEMEMDTYGIKIISWRLGGRHTRPLATMPFISAHVSLQQQSGCAIDLESLGIRQTQRRLFNLDASVNFCNSGL